VAKIDDVITALNENSTRTALACQRVDEMTVDVDKLTESIAGRGGLNERVTTVEIKLSERTSPAPPKPNHRRLKVAGGALGGGSLLLYALYNLIMNPPW
jgi:hypothetical protein